MVVKVGTGLEIERERDLGLRQSHCVFRSVFKSVHLLSGHILSAA